MPLNNGSLLPFGHRSQDDKKSSSSTSFGPSAQAHYTKLGFYAQSGSVRLIEIVNSAIFGFTLGFDNYAPNVRIKKML